MQRFLISIAAALFAFALVGCGTINKASQGLGLGIEYRNVYAEASTFEERVWLSAGLYEATLEVVAAQCVDATGSVWIACDRAASAAERIEPGLSAVLKSLATYVEAKAAVDAALSGTGKAPPELINAASVALAAVALQYAEIRADLDRFIMFTN